MLWHNQKVEGRDLVSRPGTSGQKPSSIARFAAAGSGFNSPRSSAVEPEASVKAQGDNFDVQCTLARMRRNQGKPEEVMQARQAGVPVDPLEGPAHDRLAQFDRQSNCKPEAEGSSPFEVKQ